MLFFFSKTDGGKDKISKLARGTGGNEPSRPASDAAVRARILLISAAVVIRVGLAARVLLFPARAPREDLLAGEMGSSCPSAVTQAMYPPLHEPQASSAFS